MNRLNNANLDVRIHRFLGRKFEQFPELAAKRNMASQTKKAQQERGN